MAAAWVNLVSCITGGDVGEGAGVAWRALPGQFFCLADTIVYRSAREFRWCFARHCRAEQSPVCGQFHVLHDTT